MEDSDLRPRGAQLQPAAPAQLPNPGAHKAQSDPRSHPSPPPPPRLTQPCTFPPGAVWIKAERVDE